MAQDRKIMLREQIAKRKKFTTAIFVAIILLLQLNIMFYVVNKREKEIDSSGVLTAENTTGDAIINEINEEVPEFQLERVSYEAYKLYAGAKLGEAVMYVSSDGKNITIQFDYLTTLLDSIDIIKIADSSSIYTFIDDKHRILIREQLTDVANVVSKVLGTTEKYPTESELEVLKDSFYSVMIDGTTRSVCCGGSDIVIVRSEDAEIVKIIINNYR